MDKHVIDARTRFAAKSLKLAPRETGAKIESPLTTQLPRVDEISSALKKNPKLSQRDREIFASNLGRIYDTAAKQGLEMTLSEIFTESFGEKIGVSHYKKRKRFIWLQKDGSVSGTKTAGIFHARGSDYLSLATKIAEKSHTDESDRKGLDLIVLRLIEGTSFDDRLKSTERRSIETQHDIERVLEQIVNYVGTNVDLDWMRTFVSRMSLECYLNRESGTVESINIGKEDRRPHCFDLPTDEEQYCDIEWLAPRIRLAVIYTPIFAENAINIDIPDVELDNLMGFVETYVEQRNLLVGKESVEIDWLDLPEFWELFDPKDESIECDSPDCWFACALYFEIRYDPDSQRWKPCLAVSEVIERRGWFWPESECLEFPCIPKWSGSETSVRTLDELYQRNFSNIILGESRSDTYLAARKHLVGKCRIFELNTSFIWNRDQKDLPTRDNIYAFPGESIKKILSTRMDKSNQKICWCFPVMPGGFSTAAQDTIAGAILRNHAYAPKELALAELLRRDVEKKFNLLKDLEKTCEANFQEGLDRWT